MCRRSSFEQRQENTGNGKKTRGAGPIRRQRFQKAPPVLWFGKMTSNRVEFQGFRHGVNPFLTAKRDYS